MSWPAFLGQYALVMLISPPEPLGVRASEGWVIVKAVGLGGTPF